MTKKLFLRDFQPNNYAKKLLLIMKLSTILLILTTLQISAIGLGQDAALKLDFQSGTLADLIQAIETQSDFRIFYKTDQVDIRKNLKLSSTDGTVGSILSNALEGSDINYLVLDRLIVLVPENNNPQQIKVTGIVTDGSSGEPLPGVNILIEGTTRGVITDTQGRYSIDVNESTDVLIFSYVGYNSERFEVTGRSVIDVAMIMDIKSLEEVIVVGFGSRTKKDITGSISAIKTQDLEKLPSPTPQFALQGKTTGVRVINTSGDPNAAPTIYVRGIGSWQGTSQPLYVVDGQIITAISDANEDVISAGNRDTPPNLWTLINPNDIESISVLKDASASAIYGSRGANGVILITTKKGKTGEPTLEFNAYTGISNIPKYKMLNTQQYVDIVNEMYANNLNPDITIEDELYGRTKDEDTRLISNSPQFDPQSPFYISSRETYDWQDQLIRKNALDQAYDIKLSGASERTRYYISVGYKNQEGNFLGNAMKKYTAAVNLDTDVKKWIKTGINYKFAYQDISMDDQTDLPGIVTAAPWQPLLDPTSASGYAEVLDTDPSDWKARRIYGQGARNNYLALTNLNLSSFLLQRHIGQGFVEITPFKDLTFRGSISMDYTNQDRQSVNVYANNIFINNGQDPATVAPAAPNSKGSFGSRANEIVNYQADFMATYDKTIQKHRVTLTAVIQDQYHKRFTRDMQGTNLLDVRNLRKIGYGNDLANNNSFYGLSDEKYWFGYVGRLNYIYDSKYYVDFSYRRDGSSGFIKEKRWGNFFAVSAAWRISELSFIKNLGFVNDLKLRGGYGEAGNDETVVGSYAYLSTVGEVSSYRWGSGAFDPLGNYYTGAPVSGFPNTSLEWEVAGTATAGFDAVLFNNKVDLTVEYYNRVTRGIQQFVNLPYSVGTDDPAFNIGTLQNKGLDMSAGYSDKIGDFTFELTGNISFLKNKVTKLYNGQPLDTDYGRVEEGRSVGHIWGYKVGGIFQNQEDIDQYYALYEDETIGNLDYIAPGDLYFQDCGGNPTVDEPFYSTIPDSLINNYDQTELGNTIPGHTYGINLSAGWKGLDASLNFYGEGNVEKYNEVRQALESLDGQANFSTAVLNRWTSTHTNTDMPRAVIGDPAGNNRYSDRYVESAAFFRLNNWQLGYTIPQSLLQKTHAIKSLRIYFGGQNNIYSFRYSGIDPVNERKPLPRAYYMGLNVKF